MCAEVPAVDEARHSLRDDDPRALRSRSDLRSAGCHRRTHRCPGARPAPQSDGVKGVLGTQRHMAIAASMFSEAIRPPSIMRMVKSCVCAVGASRRGCAAASRCNYSVLASVTMNRALLGDQVPFALVSKYESFLVAPCTAPDSDRPLPKS
jgi:hypothetical protein